MRFVFDTSVLIDYLREDRPGDQEVAADAFAIASGLGNTFLNNDQPDGVVWSSTRKRQMKGRKNLM